MARGCKASIGYFFRLTNGILYPIATTCGSLWRGASAVGDSNAVSHLNNAGVVLIGEDNPRLHFTDCQTSHEIGGIAKNPEDHAVTPVGSPGVTAAAAMCASNPFFDVGSDIGSSICSPPHFRDIASHKRSRGIISLQVAPPTKASDLGCETLQYIGSASRHSDWLAPLAVGWLAEKIPLGTSIPLAAGVGYLIVILCACMIPETNGISLDDIVSSSSSGRDKSPRS
ncbi:amidase family protein [Paraburkholderia lycopersici]